jgi:ABC-type sugar transport system ATPase subunit
MLDARPELSVEGVSVRFGGLTALDDVSLSVAPGQVVGVIGPNGAGKTTLFNVICGFVRPDAGGISWRGLPLGKVRPHRLAGLGIARTVQGVRLFPHLTALENVMVGADHVHRPRLASSFLGLPSSDRAERALREVASSALDRLGAGDVGGFWDLVQQGQDDLKWCGSAPLYTFMKAMPTARGKLLRYEQWNIDEQSVVSFGALSFRKPWGCPSGAAW